MGTGNEKTGYIISWFSDGRVANKQPYLVYAWILNYRKAAIIKDKQLIPIYPGCLQVQTHQPIKPKYIRHLSLNY